MQQMLQRLVDVEGGHEPLGVASQVGGELREAALEGLWQDDEEKRQIVFHVTGVGFGEWAESESMIRHENQNRVF